MKKGCLASAAGCSPDGGRRIRGGDSCCRGAGGHQELLRRRRGGRVPLGHSQQTASVARTLGLKSVRVTLQWKPGQTQVPATSQLALQRMVFDAWGIRVVASVYGNPQDAPRTADARAQYCSFVADLLRDNPEIDDVSIWDDPNDGSFWTPQFDADGKSVAPADYEALLATCYDAAHAVRPNANVIAVAVSKSSAVPGAFTLAWHPPADWFAKLGAAYRASGRTKPIFDTLGYVPHPTGSAERPWAKHPGSSAISLGDYPTLMSVLGSAFGGTAQPVPGQGSTRIWYLGQGYQTRPDPARGGYTGTENDPSPVPSWSPQEATDRGEGPGLDQPLQLADAIRVAYCQPAVGAYFNFHLYDESNLAGWQSGVFWPDGQPKAAYQALRRVAGEVNSNSIDCSAFSSAGVPPRPAPVKLPAQQPLRITDLQATSGGGVRRDRRPEDLDSRPTFRSRTGWSIRHPDRLGACRLERRRLDRGAVRARLELQLPHLGQRRLGRRPARAGDPRPPHPRPSGPSGRRNRPHEECRPARRAAVLPDDALLGVPVPVRGSAGIGHQPVCAQRLRDVPEPAERARRRGVLGRDRRWPRRHG
jgi:hypothetical protein